MPKIPSDPPTIPDLSKFKCDECGGKGSVTHADAAGQPCKRSCDICFGKGFVDRERYDWWRKHRQPGDQ